MTNVDEEIILNNFTLYKQKLREKKVENPKYKQILYI